MSVALICCGARTRYRSSESITSAPASRNLLVSAPRQWLTAPVMLTLPPVITAASAKVPASMRSGINAIDRAVQLRCALDLNRARPCAVNARPHGAEKVRKVQHFGLDGGILDVRHTLGQAGRHDQVLSARVAGIV